MTSRIQMARIYSFVLHLIIATAMLSLAGCVSLATDRLANNLSNAMLNQNDPEIVRTGAPAYLLLLDSLIEGSPDDPDLLFTGARLYSAYGGGLIDDQQRQRLLTDKALQYAIRGICLTQTSICASKDKPFSEFNSTLSQTQITDVEGLFVFGASWATWIQANSADWNAIADLAKVEAILQKVTEIDPRFEQGRAQLYLGIIRSQLPPSLGGKPEIGRQHFERAIEYSNGQDLIAKVEFARRYARLVFDKPLHDRLLQEVLNANPAVPGLTLSNVLAQQQAKVLLSEDYF